MPHAIRRVPHPLNACTYTHPHARHWIPSLSVLKRRWVPFQERVSSAIAEAKAGGDCVVVKLRQTYLTFYYAAQRWGKGNGRTHTGERRERERKRYTYDKWQIYICILWVYIITYFSYRFMHCQVTHSCFRFAFSLLLKRISLLLLHCATLKDACDALPKGFACACLGLIMTTSVFH